MEAIGIICSVVGAGTIAFVLTSIIVKADGGVERELGHERQRDRRHVAHLQEPK